MKVLARDGRIGSRGLDVMCCDWRVIVPGMESDFTIHRLSRVDSEEFRSIRLEALKNFPEAFGSTYEREAGEPISFFGDRLERNAVFGARVEMEL